MIETLADIIDKNSSADGVSETAVPGMHCLRYSAPNMSTPSVYMPSLCVIAQGTKEVLLESEIYRYEPSQFLAVSVDLPLIGNVTEASPEKPYLCLVLDIDPRQLSDLIPHVDAAPDAAPERGLFVGRIDAPLLDSVLRLAKLLDTPADIPMLAPMAFREIYYRLLRGEHGRRVAQIGVPDSHTYRIARVLQTIKTEFTRSLRVEELAELANMSASSFHQHFKAVTAMSPLQYQKRLRLMEARRILLAEESDAAAAAYRVGYESPSQFSREYSRMFGAPPMRDVMTLRETSA
jgi:AraC-like DNA-binding protein